MMYNFLFAASLGTFLEFFDLALYSFCSAIIALNFFPQHDPYVAIISTWGIFAISYLLRPLGALLFGYIADNVSSKLAMVTSMVIMSLATIGIGLLPGYATLGIWAPILLLVLRMLQSMAVSPEYNLPSVFMREHNWFSKRFGLVSSITAFVTGLGTMGASWCMAYLLKGASAADVSAYQWRLPFIIAGLLVGTIGIYLRLRLDRGLGTVKLTQVPFRKVWQQQGTNVLRGMLIAGYVGCISYAMFAFFVHQLQVIKGLTVGAALSVLAKGSLLPALASLGAGYISDYVQREKIMCVAALLIAITGGVLFAYLPSLSMMQTQNLGLLMLASLGLFAGCFPGYCADLFINEYRYTGAFLSYNVGMSLVGGLSPLLFIKASTYSYYLPATVIVIYSVVIGRQLILSLKSKANLSYTQPALKST